MIMIRRDIAVNRPTKGISICHPVGLKEEYLGICNTFVDLSSEDLLNYTEKQVEKGNFSNDFAR